MVTEKLNYVQQFFILCESLIKFIRHKAKYWNLAHIGTIFRLQKSCQIQDDNCLLFICYLFYGMGRLNRQHLWVMYSTVLWLICNNIICTACARAEDPLPIKFFRIKRPNLTTVHVFQPSGIDIALDTNTYIALLLCTEPIKTKKTLLVM